MTTAPTIASSPYWEDVGVAGCRSVLECQKGKPENESPAVQSSNDKRQGEGVAMRLSVTILGSADRPALPDAICHLSRNRRCENRYRSFRQTVKVCPPVSRC